MKLLFIIKYIIFFATIQVFCQNNPQIEKLMTKWTLDCEEIKFNSIFLIRDYLEHSKPDSAMIIADYWDDNCGNSEMLTRAKILISIANKPFSEKIYNEDVIFYLNAYREFLQADSIEKYYSYGGNSDFDLEIELFNNFTKTFSKELLRKTKFESLEYVLAKHYSGDTDSTFYYIRSFLYNDTDIHKYYNNYIQYIKDFGYSHWGFSIGQWIPAVAENKVLGTHPQICFVIGRSNRFSETNFYFHFIFGNTPSPYSFSYKNINYSTTKFTGGGIGFEFGNSIYYSPKHELKYYLGFAIEGYSPPESDINPDSKGINSGYVSIGFGYGFRFGNYSNPTIGLQVRYNQYIFDTSGLNGPQGSTVTMRLSCSFAFGDYRKEYLEKYAYDLNK